MGSVCLSINSTSKPLLGPPTSAAAASTTSSSSSPSSSCRCSLVSFTPMFGSGRLISTSNSNRKSSRQQKQVVCMAPDEEKLTRRNPLDFPIQSPVTTSSLQRCLESLGLCIVPFSPGNSAFAGRSKFCQKNLSCCSAVSSEFTSLSTRFPASHKVAVSFLDTIVRNAIEYDGQPFHSFLH
ncbi:conserved hypothetical protein [Ricinus communis]|uniref:Uncharacterized protein n=1 Tax=Ricinus communis TaxID=3988 RepID=B9RKS0_RICCO|nr:conserved hypothetical protein [Ricinus communis]